MIRKIVLQNFLSHESSVVEFSGSTISITGDNGAGKSSLLEAIPYGYYGIGRGTRVEMSRTMGDGSHEVQIWEDGDIRITRGRKSGGTGYFHVHVVTGDTEELIAKGDEADAWVRDHLGMDSDTFMLTAFFGLHDVRNDTLIRVTPSARLEAIQKLSKVGPYRKFLESAKRRIKSIQDEIDKLNSKKEGVEAAKADENLLQKNIESAEKDIAAWDVELAVLRENRENLYKKELKYQAFAKEKIELSKDRSVLSEIIDNLTDESDELTELLSDLKNQVAGDLKRKNKLLEDPAISADIDSIESEQNEISKDSGELNGLIDLRGKAVEGDLKDKTSCPLCGSHVDATIISTWNKEIIAMRKKVELLIDKYTENNKVLDQHEKINRELKDIEKSTANATREAETASKRLTEIHRVLPAEEAKLRKMDTKIFDLQKKLGEEYQNIHNQIQKSNTAIEDMSSNIAASNREIAVLKKSIIAAGKARKIIIESEKEIKEKKKELESLQVLSRAWSRYGIPMQLMKRTMAIIQERASAVYQEFDNGRIAVTEVEDRGKPGVEFQLIDKKGTRTFGQISTGEKVLFFIAVRVAISYLVAENNAISVDYLILDEALGNLSPSRRDDLIRLINKVLRKLFPHVIIVSHTEMRDIFSQTIRVKSTNDISEVEEVHG